MTPSHLRVQASAFRAAADIASGYGPDEVVTVAHNHARRTADRIARKLNAEADRLDAMAELYAGELGLSGAGVQKDGSIGG